MSEDNPSYPTEEEIVYALEMVQAKVGAISLIKELRTKFEGMGLVRAKRAYDAALERWEPGTGLAATQADIARELEEEDGKR